MTVSSIRYKPVDGGALGGHFALHISLGAGNGPSGYFTSTELTTRIREIFGQLELKSKVRGVLISCLEAVGDNEEMTSLVQTLLDWGFMVILWVKGETRYSWFDPRCYITVFVTTQHWPNFRVNEIRYVMPTDSNEWTEPDVYDDVNGRAACYMVPKEASIPIIHFATECKRPWGLIGVSVDVAFLLKDPVNESFNK